mgnify:FL=1
MSDRKAEFRRVIQNLTAYLEHSNYERPFRFAIDYDPEREEVDTRLQEKMKMSCRKKLPDDKENMNWAICCVPDDCKCIFICGDETFFEDRRKHGIEPLYDGGYHETDSSIPCFIGYIPNADLKDLERQVESHSTR